MRYAIVSDIHANQQAWKAVWLDIRSIGVDQVICLGDLVGYGPNPKEVLEALYTSADYFVLGNHDAALSGLVDASCFNDAAREVLHWTARQVGHAATQFLAKLPLSLVGPGFRCAHADLADPGRFRYIFDPEDAAPSWQAVPEPLLFVGHTHIPGIMVIGHSGTPHWIPPEDFALETGKRFLVNVGSVGQPRDEDTRSSYCIFDAAAGAVFWRKIPFDLDAYRDAMVRQEMPAGAGAFLEWDPRLSRPPVRAMVPFQPPARAVNAAVSAGEIPPLPTLQRRLRRWKTLFLVALLLLTVAAGGAFRIWASSWAMRVEPVEIAGPAMSAVRAVDFALDNNLLVLPPDSVAAGRPIPGWTVRLGDRDRQSVAWSRRVDSQAGFILRSGDPTRELAVVSPPIHVARDLRFGLQALVKKSPDFQGTVTLALVLIQATDITATQGAFETNLSFLVAEPRQPRQDGWLLAKKTMDGRLPARAHSVQLMLRGSFKGTVGIRDIRLERKE